MFFDEDLPREGAGFFSAEGALMQEHHQGGRDEGEGHLTYVSGAELAAGCVAREARFYGLEGWI